MIRDQVVLTVLGAGLVVVLVALFFWLRYSWMSDVPDHPAFEDVDGGAF